MSKVPSPDLISLVGHNRKIQKSFGFTKHRSLNVELFAGAGGFGAGAALAGMHFDIAINHNPAALSRPSGQLPARNTDDQ